MVTIEEDAVLWSCNESELLALARRQGLGFIRRGLPLETLVQLVGGYIEMRPEYLSASAHTRYRLERFIQANIGSLASQLPGCDGHCTTYPCSEGKHAGCFFPNRDKL